MRAKVKYEVAPEFAELESWIIQLRENFSGSGETIFKLRNEVKVFTLNNYILNVKAFKIPNPVNRFVYVSFRGSKAARSYRYAKLFRSLGIDTPMAVGFVEYTEHGLLANSYYVSLHLNCNYTLREVIENHFEIRDDILRQWVRFTYEKLHKNGIFHLDYSPGNILITQSDGQYKFSIVDLNRMSFGFVDFKKGLSNFCQLGVDQATLGLIGHEYATLRNENSAEAEIAILDIDRKRVVALEKSDHLKYFFKKLFRSGHVSE